MGYIPQYQSVNEHDFISLALAHDAMDKHVVSDRTSYGGRFCKNCHMPLNAANKIDAPRGNKNPHYGNFMYDVSQVSAALQTEYVSRLLATFMSMRCITMIERILNGHWSPAFRPILFKYFMPEHRAVSADYAKVALLVAYKPGQADDDCRQFACLNPDVALNYASDIDKGPHALTRAAACRRGDLALEYAKGIDGCYHISTFSKTLQDKDLAFKYLAYMPKVKEVVDTVFNMFVKNGTTSEAVRWAQLCGGNDATRDMMLAGAIDANVYNYAINIHGKPDDLLRAKVLSGNDARRALEYACGVDRVGRDDTRTVACKDIDYAMSYAYKVDKGPHDMTRQASLANPLQAKNYAESVDRVPRDDTRAAAAGNPEAALHYATQVDRKPHPLTLAAACRYSETAYKYACVFGACAVTRTAACKTPGFAVEYALNVDKAPCDETRTAASYAANTADRYKCWEDIKIREAKENDKANAAAPVV
jgi:hypothetical protein